jgi:glycosyltransferase involved in cell wall biosynthesis
MRFRNRAGGSIGRCRGGAVPWSAQGALVEGCPLGSSERVTLLALTLNEIDGVKAIMPQIKRAWADQIIIADGGSTDGTVEWLRDNGYEVYIQKKKGIRHAYLEVLPLIRGDIVLTFSPDGNCPPASIPPMLEKIGDGYDLVIGSRYLGDAMSEDDDAVTGFGNWLFTKTVNVLHRASYTDAMVIFRAFRKSLVHDLDLDREDSYRLPERLFGTVISWEPLMSVRAAKAGKRITEIPVGEPPRIGGKRKLQVLRWGAAYYFQFWRELWHWRSKTQQDATETTSGNSDLLPVEPRHAAATIPRSTK